MENKKNIAIFGCERDEAEVFRKLSSEYGVTVSLIKDAVSESNAKLADGCRCVSVSHKAELSEPLLLALKNAGVKYITPVFLLLKLNGFTDAGTVVDFAIVCHKDGFHIVRILD